MTILLIALLLGGVPVTWHYLELTYYLAASWVLLIGAALLTSSLTAVFRDFGELLGIGVKVDGTVGEHGDMVLETHQERSGYQRCSWLGLDDLQGRAHGVGGGVHGAGDAMPIPTSMVPK